MVLGVGSLVVGRSFGSGIASFRLLLKGDQLMFNSCESLVEFLEFVEACEDGLVE